MFITRLNDCVKRWHKYHASLKDPPRGSLNFDWGREDKKKKTKGNVKSKCGQLIYTRERN